MTRQYSFALPLIAIATYMFLYLPIAVLILFSFNDSTLPFIWGGLTTKWYTGLLDEPELWIALKNSLVIALATVTLTISMSLFYICSGARSRILKLMPIFFAGIAIPEVVMAVSLLSFFSFFSVPLGITSLITGHSLLSLGFVVPMLRTRYAEIDYRLMEASADLGASEFQTFVKIILPLMMPAIMASGLLVFILSMDDFLISFFCAGASTQTLSLYIFGMLRLGASPMINALSTLILAASSLLVLAFCSINLNAGEQKGQHAQ